MGFHGPYPQYGWDFPEEIPEKFRKDPGTLSERFLEFPSRVRLGCPKPYNSRHLRLPERFPEFSPESQYGWGRLFFQKWFWRGPLYMSKKGPIWQFFVAFPASISDRILKNS